MGAERLAMGSPPEANSSSRTSVRLRYADGLPSSRKLRLIAARDQASRVLCDCIEVLKQFLVEYGIFKPTDFRGAPAKRREAVGPGQRTGGVHHPPQGVASLEGSLAHVDPSEQARGD